MEEFWCKDFNVDSKSRSERIKTLEKNIMQEIEKLSRHFEATL